MNVVTSRHLEVVADPPPPHGTVDRFLDMRCRCVACYYATTRANSQRHERLSEINEELGLLCSVNGCERGQSNLTNSMCPQHYDIMRKLEDEALANTEDDPQDDSDLGPSGRPYGRCESCNEVQELYRLRCRECRISEGRTPTWPAPPKRKTG